ncbi:coiled coil domain containing protein 124 [Echinococcus multilocularis]|uniref:Coiled coil domain containing protein 124 n=1 Tax=Echinococcus multilocularis TaxID=6211 RepID=U6I1Y6_ECHMU|nr:coiled coil domain containing protein 124 [Echinococcus multilocularis]CDS41710.1 coiled coil domain containing protein 124 [Echinococcus multilocularis]
MPKKFGTNTKSQEARERKEAAKELQKAKEAKAEEDAYWEENDKHVNRKLQRKDEREAKRVEAMKKRQELRKLHDEEMRSLQGASAKTPASNPNKLTQAQIAAARARLNAQLAALAPKRDVDNLAPLMENPNRVADDVIEARTVEDAIKALNVTGDSPTEKHPERRLKAAYLAYEEKMLPELRKEYPGMRHSQLTQMIFKSFQTAPENPKNQAHKQYNEK